MHFRFRGNNIQVVKSQPDPGTGKAKSVPLGSINRVTLQISDSLRNNCSPSELKDIEGWVNRYQTIDAMKRKHAAVTLPEQIAAAASWLEMASDDEAREIVDDLVTAMGEMRRALNRRGLL